MERCELQRNTATAWCSSNGGVVEQEKGVQTWHATSLGAPQHEYFSRVLR